MGFKAGLRKPGGGILHNREGVIESYRITTETPWDSDRNDLLYFEPTIREDGATEGVPQTLFFGSTEYYKVSDDGQTAISIDEDGDERAKTSLGLDTGAGKFLGSMLDVGFPEDRLPDLDGGAPLNLKGIVGARFRFEQRVNEALTKEKGKKQGKYNYTDLVVAEVLSLPSGKTNGKLAGAKGKTATPADVDANDDVDVPELAEQTIIEVLSAEKTKTLPFKKIKMAVFGRVQAHAQRNAIVKFADNLTNIQAMDSVKYDSKKDAVSLA